MWRRYTEKGRKKRWWWEDVIISIQSISLYLSFHSAHDSTTKNEHDSAERRLCVYKVCKHILPPRFLPNPILWSTPKIYFTSCVHHTGFLSCPIFSEYGFRIKNKYWKVNLSELIPFRSCLSILPTFENLSVIKFTK